MVFCSLIQQSGYPQWLRSQQKQNQGYSANTKPIDIYLKASCTSPCQLQKFEDQQRFSANPYKTLTFDMKYSQKTTQESKRTSILLMKTFLAWFQTLLLSVGSLSPKRFVCSPYRRLFYLFYYRAHTRLVRSIGRFLIVE